MVTCPDWFFFEILKVQIYRRAAAQAKLSLLVFVRSVGQGQALKHRQPLAGRSIESGRLGAAGASAAAVAVLQGVLGGGPLEPSWPREPSVASGTSQQLAVHLGFLLFAVEGSDVAAV